MTLYRNLLLLNLLLSFLAFGCSPKCEDTARSCSDNRMLQICVKGEKPVDQGCGAGLKCDAGECIDDGCSNGRLDAGEAAVDCGGICAPCVACRVHADCGVDGFCDSASAYVCSKRCRTNDDCANTEAWDGNYCRGDGRCSPKVFETVWEVTLEDPTVVLPFNTDEYKSGCDFQILWGDEPEGTDITTLEHNIACEMDDRMHTYEKAGRYHVKLIGTYDAWGASGYGTVEADKLYAVISFGPVGLGYNAFMDASNLRAMPAKDIPDASKLVTLASAFEGASSFNAPIGHWDTSHVTKMNNMFRDAKAFDQALGQWDSSHVTDMSKMFWNARVFNQPIGAWNTSQVTDMNGMFNMAIVFNQPIGDWDTSKVTRMTMMFNDARAFNQPIGTWDCSKVTDMDMMFSHAQAFNQPIGDWNTSQVTYMAAMFSHASAFNQPIDAWNVSKMYNMSEMFRKASAFNQPLDHWDTKNVASMGLMFSYASSFDQDLSAWHLRPDVRLIDVFNRSGMSVDHLCALKAVGGEWLKQWTTLGEGFFNGDDAVRANGEISCGAGKLCSETASQCIDLKTIEYCTASKMVRRETCGDGFVCDAVACASGGDCCVAGKLCSKTANQCLNLKTIEHCTASEVARTEICGNGLVCEASACASGGDWCVPSQLCTKTLRQCLDLRTAEVCVENGRAEVEICGEGLHCDAELCAKGADCCVAGKVCNQTANTCLDKDSLELCVVDQRPSVQACAEGENCDRGRCVPANCANHRLDEGEDAVDCGGTCAPCLKCRVHADCGVDGFCDSASAFVCSKRCRTNDDCSNTEAWDGNYCRGDGRCSPKVFETVWQFKLKDMSKVILNDEWANQEGMDEYWAEREAQANDSFDDNSDDEEPELEKSPVEKSQVEAAAVEEPSIVLPFNVDDPNAACDFQILWGDEPEGTDITTLPRVTDCMDVENRTHTYEGPGRYHVKIIGTYDGWGEANLLTSKLRGVLSFGPVGLSSEAFNDASHLCLMPTKDIPDASKLKSLKRAFKDAVSFNAPIGHWDTSNVIDMSEMFENAFEFNQAIGAWDTSHVTNMRGMFSKVSVFNQAIGAWDTSHVTDMFGMFYYASAFNQPLGRWDTSHVIDMGHMFAQTESFNQPINSWNTSCVKDMGSMFQFAYDFNQPIGDWDTSNVMDMDHMFYRAESFNQDLSRWNLNKAVDLESIFNSSYSLALANLCKLKARGGAWLAVSEVWKADCK